MHKRRGNPDGWADVYQHAEQNEVPLASASARPPATSLSLLGSPGTPVGIPEIVAQGRSELWLSQQNKFLNVENTHVP